uniref:ATP synthase F0 subunit 8 n=1 Tax=Agrilus sichuanus TaxID=2946725 RepID=UPI00207AAD29|nr:ATP synthase F0 subunit 8 [Agrilus sichuanus]URN73053.1 ATP synthase F0 subunit 8 [Agrilus sichuanus]
MPQMAPMSWLILFFIFSITFMIFNIINYYSILYYPTFKMKTSKQIKKINWKW